VILTRSGAFNPAVIIDGIRLDPGANGTAVWGNIIGSLQVAAPAIPAVGGDGIAVLGPFKLTSVTPDGDSLYDNIVGNVPGALRAGCPARRCSTTASSAKTSGSTCRARAKGRKEPWITAMMAST
jgi:hypothetical protein